MNVAIMTDTNSGLSQQEAEAMGIFLLPMPVLVDSKCYFEGRDLSQEFFFEALESNRDVTTSMPSPADVTDMWDKILGLGFDSLVFIPMSSGLSSACAVAKSLALDYKGKVFVADNHRISVTMVESVERAVDLAKSGVSAEEICAILEKEAYKISVYISVNTLKFLKKSGRVTAAGAALGSILHIKPVLTIQGGKLDAFAKARGMEKARQIMMDSIKKDINERHNTDMNNDKIWLAGAGLTADEIKAYEDYALNAFPNAQISYHSLSLSICAHLGPKALGIGVCK